MDAMKMKITVGVLALGMAAGFVLAGLSCKESMSLKSGVMKEKSSRFDTEEKLNKLIQEKGKIEDQLKAVVVDFEADKSAHQATKNALAQEQLVNKSLKEELQKVNKLKEALESNLREALLAKPAAEPAPAQTPAAAPAKAKK
jgi:hypothetical protein